ncbi:MAG: sigma-70 family RNA polymerase sigma factor [Bryobacterales bacterium]|nr:sigma-70 family RNA polymerase sigma factor [Bryobacterales bacterium]
MANSATNLFEEAARQLWLPLPQQETDVAKPASLVVKAEPIRKAEEQLVREGSTAAVREILASMPDRDRAILKGLYLDGKSQTEVAEELKVSIRYVRLMVHRAKAKFRNALLSGAATLLSAAKQEGMATTVLAEESAQTDSTTQRFQELIEAKYTRGLTINENRELANLEARLDENDASFYAPTLERARDAVAQAEKKRRLASKPA